MLDLILWLITVHVVAIAAFPFVFRAFPALADRGWGLAMPAGMLIVSVFMWLLTYTKLVPNSGWAWWIGVLLIGALGAVLARRRWRLMRAFIRRRWHVALIAEVLFLVFFAAFALLRSHDPNITSTEKPMEILMLNASVEAEHAPPEDPWLAGEPVAYYYGGYWALGGLGSMSGVAPGVVFNLSLALIAGMSASAMFSLVYSVTARDGAPKSSAILTGIISGVALLLIASLAGWWEMAANLGIGTQGFYNWLEIEGLAKQETGDWKPDRYWWWFRASRIINTFSETGGSLDFTIQEFPAFSFVLGDLHPHVISIPFVITGLAAAYNLMVSRTRWGFGWIARHPMSAAAVALIVGAAGFINQADIILMTALFFGVVTLKTLRERKGATIHGSAIVAVIPLVPLVALAVAVFSPFYFGTLDGQIQSPPLAPAEFGSRPVHFLTVWGLFALVIAPFVLYYTNNAIRPYLSAGIALLRAPKSQDMPVERDLSPERSLIKRMGRGIWLTPVALTLGPYLIWAVTHLWFNDLAESTDLVTRLGTVLPLGIAFVALFFTLVTRARAGKNDGAQFMLLISALSVYLLFGAELFFVHDLFGNRMNTVFKFYYQSWIMLAAVGGYAVFQWQRIHLLLKTKAAMISRTAAVALAVLLIGPAWYPVAAAVSKAEDYTGPVTLDGWRFLHTFPSDDGFAIDWLNDEAERGAHIVEAVGGGYTEYGRISAATGLPTIMGWPGHERQWRGPDDEALIGREEDVRRIYESPDEAETRALLDKYDVTYVVIGDRERSAYPSLSATKFDSLGESVFTSGETTIYKVQGQQG